MISYSRYKSTVPLLSRSICLYSPCYDVLTSEPGAKVKARSGQIGVKVPNRKVIPKNAVLESLKDSVAIDWLTNTSRLMRSIDLAPSSVTQTAQMLQASENAKEAVRLVEDGTEILKKGWVWDGEIKANLEPMKISDGTKDDDPLNELHDRMLENDIDGLSVAYKTMLENSIEIPHDIKEKVVAFACYKMRRQKSNTGTSDSFRTIIDNSRPYTKYMYSVILRCCLAMRKEQECNQWFEEMLKHDYFPDKITANGLLRLGRSGTPGGLKTNLLKEMKTRGYTPSASAVMALFPVQKARNLDSEKCAALLSEFIEEAKYCTNDSQLEAYVEALGIAGKSLQNTSLVYALLQIIDTFALEKVHSSNGYLDAMISADRMDDVELAKEILSSAVKHSTAIHVRLFSLYIALHSRVSTPEVFLENAVNYLGQIVPVDHHLYKEIVGACSHRNWPQLMPYVFNLLDFNLDANKDIHVVWFERAWELYDSADEDCATEIANIACLVAQSLHRHRRSPSVRYLNSLVTLLIKCKNNEGLNAILDLSDQLSNTKYKEILSRCTQASQTHFTTE